jgi:hypothetical protein
MGAEMAQTINLVGDKWDTQAGKIIADAGLDEMRGSVLANLSDEIASALRNAYADGCEEATTDTPQSVSVCNCKLEGYAMPWDEPCPIHHPKSPSNPHNKPYDELTAEEDAALHPWSPDKPAPAPLSQGEGIEGYLRERDERELETGKDDPQGAIKSPHGGRMSDHQPAYVASLEINNLRLIEQARVLRRALVRVINLSNNAPDGSALDECNKDARAALRTSEGA